MLLPSLLCRSRSTTLIAVALAFGLAPLAQQRALAQARGSVPRSSPPQSQRVDPSASVQLKVRRLPDAVELVIEGTGPAPLLLQGLQGNRWQGQLTTATPALLRAGPQQLALPDLGLQSISFDGAGTSFSLAVTSSPGVTLGRPVVSADGRNLIVTFPSAVPQASLQVARPNALQPGAVPLPRYAPPLQPRAVAPPLGDMAVGSMVLRNPGYVQLSGPPVTMTLKNAPAKDVLMALAQLGGYGFAYVEDSSGQKKDEGESQSLLPISIAFRGESYARAFNSALMAAGLQAKKDGNMVFAGPAVLSKSFGVQVSRVYRLNQVGANAAADYIANLGARVTKTDTVTASAIRGISEDDTIKNESGRQISSAVNVEGERKSSKEVVSYGAADGPLLGLRATTDTRLGTITLFGDPGIVAVAEQYLRQLDLRQRQVALNVKILDVTLDNESSLDSSFAWRWGSNFIVNNSGRLTGSFGGVALSADLPSSAPAVLPDSDNFYAWVRAQVVSGSTKLLASPTLILQENPSLLRAGDKESAGDQEGTEAQTGENQKGLVSIGLDGAIGRRRANEGVVRVGTNVVTNYEIANPELGGNIVCKPTLSTAGLVLGARVEKIDDNGFVTFVLSPSISAITDQEPPPRGCGSTLNILSVRSLDTGALRVRDGQTLILTGVISETDRTEVSKWPILGDIPLVGQFFRSTNSRKDKRELVIMVTPRIISDEMGGAYGYGYQPATDPARQLFGVGS